MQFLIKLFRSISSLFAPTKKESIEKEEFLGELIFPIRFQNLEEEEIEENLIRTEKESLKLFEAFKTLEKDKQETIARSTRDRILQNKILEHKDERLVCNLAINPWLSEDIQYELATGENIKIKACLCRKVGLNLNVQKILARDSSKEVRRMLVRWQRPLNPTVASFMSYDDDLDVRKIIATNLGEGIRHENIFSFKDRGDAAFNILLEDESKEVRACLSQNKNIKNDNQIKLAIKCIDNKEWGNLTLLAENTSLTINAEEEIIKLLNTSTIKFTRESIIKKLKQNSGLISRKLLVK